MIINAQFSRLLKILNIQNKDILTHHEEVNPVTEVIVKFILVVLIFIIMAPTYFKNRVMGL